MGKIKKIIKKFVDYTIQDDKRIYQLKGTPLKISRSLTNKFQKKYGNLPIEAKKIVIDNYMGSGYGCNPKYVTEQLLSGGKDYDIVWTVKNAASRKEEFPKGVRLVEYLSEDAMREYATAAIWLCNYHLVAYFNRGLQKKKGQRYIQMWHGSFGIKKIENDCDILTVSKSWLYLAKKNSRLTDYWISNSRFETEIYSRAFWDVKKILEYGHPRNDIFFREENEEIVKKVNTYFEIEEKKKLFLYVPTFREKGASSVSLIDAEGLRRAWKKKTAEDWEIAVRFHPRMKQEEKEAFLARWKFVKDATDYPDIQELFVRADAAMTDYSSGLFDYVLTGKPGFLFVPDRNEYDEERGFYYPLEQSPFAVAETNEQLWENIFAFDAEEYKKKTELFLREKGSKEDGHAAERVADLVEDMVENNG